MMDKGYMLTTIQVCDVKDKELEQKINESLSSQFKILSDYWFEETKIKAFRPIIHCKSSRYLSV